MSTATATRQRKPRKARGADDSTPPASEPVQPHCLLKAPEIRIIPLAQIERDGANHRLTGPANEQAMRELQQSMRSGGLQQPILVYEKEDGGYLLGFGFRRCAAAELVGWVTIPARVEQMPKLPDGSVDRAAIEHVRAVENLDRQNLNPMEEAVVVAQMIDSLKQQIVDRHGPEVMDIADTESACIQEAATRIGRSETWVRDRCYLQRLGPKVRAKVIDGTLRLAFAREIAKLGDYEDQEDIAEHCELKPDGKSWAGLRDVQQMVDQRLRSLKIVPWPLDADAWPKNKAIVGPCVACPFNSATDKLLFEHDDKAPEDGFCLNGGCFEAKQSECRKALDKAVATIVKQELPATPKTAEEIGPAFVKPASIARAAKKQMDPPKPKAERSSGQRAKSYEELVREAEWKFRDAERDYESICGKKVIEAASGNALRKLGLILLNYVHIPWHPTPKQIKKLAPVVDALISEDRERLLQFITELPDDQLDAYHDGNVTQQVARKWNITLDPPPDKASFMPEKPKDDGASKPGKKKSKKQQACEEDDSGNGDDADDLDDDEGDE